ncbi:hypothetical protein PsorP6_011812 [Peronosclerospora sorghi]|uniref:Uncharacterized protein n=1 Tax=Peronosclerospora sorghi TaxID=230839 RepID=A0ACC0WJT5_9STRA|nr:hypothetical protein PsorP6_011812 [Peronosclerospora sorghi]
MCSASMEELATEVKSLQGVDNYKEVVRHLLCLSVRSYQDSRLMVCHSHLMDVVLVQSNMGVQIASFRSKLVEVVCESILRIVVVTVRDFQEMANALLSHIITTAKNSSAAIRQPGAKLLNKISKIVRYDLAVMNKVTYNYMMLRLIFAFWEKEEVLPWESDVLGIIRQDWMTSVKLSENSLVKCSVGFLRDVTDREQACNGVPLHNRYSS